MINPVPWTREDLVAATGGTVLSRGPEVPASFTGICTNSREISRDQVFLPLIGDRFDAHRFIPDVLKAGVKCVIVGKGADLGNLEIEKALCIQVQDTKKALGDLAAFQRKRVRVKVVAITGSNGKTTTKEMTAAVLSQSFKVLATKGNLNNDIGLPLTLLGLGHEHELAVVEMGMNSPEEIRYLTRIARPDVGIITNVGTAHIEKLGSVEGIADAKGELLEDMDSKSVAVLNRDNTMFERLRSKRPEGSIIKTFGSDSKSDIRAENVRVENPGCRFTLVSSGNAHEVSLHVAGEVMAQNACAAAMAGELLGMAPGDIVKGLESYRPTEGRMEFSSLEAGAQLIDDTYNASPDAVKAALKTLVSLEGHGKTIAVLGDMLELGENAETLHREVGVFAAKCKIDFLLATGNFAGDLREGAISGGFDPSRIIPGEKPELLAMLKTMLGPGDKVLVKGSRGMHMEDIVRGLKEKQAPA